MRTLLMLCLIAGASAQVRTAAPMSETAPLNLPAQKVGPDDLISVSVYDSPELTRTVRVSADGYLRLPMVRQRIHADGRLPAELEVAIAEALVSEKILVEPVVTVGIVEYRSRPISVAGAVKKPLTFQAVGNVTLLDALSRAEGLAPEAGPEVLVSRTQPGSDGETTNIVRRVPVKALIDAADPAFNLRLYGGEEVRVPEAGRIFVVGNVKRPGAFPMRDLSDTTLLKVLALAEGLMPFANKNAYIYRREGGDGAKNEIPVELGRILERKSPDIPLQPNDILYIPDNKGRRLSLSAVERVLSFGTATASGMLVWGAAR